MLPRPLSRRGFTLIEIIVVCLMIGILASFAVPEYLRSIETAKADDAVAMVVLTALGDGARRYVMNEFSSLGSNLVIVLPGRSESLRWRRRAVALPARVLQLPLRPGLGDQAVHLPGLQREGGQRVRGLGSRQPGRRRRAGRRRVAGDDPHDV